jgi:hypothetical protein
MSKLILIAYDAATSETAPVTFADGAAHCRVIVLPRRSDSPLNALVAPAPSADAAG